MWTCLPKGQDSLQPANWRYVASWQPSLSERSGRLPAVFTEGADSSPLDWGSVSEACEIGGLGTLAVGPLGRVAREGEVSCGSSVEGRLDRSVT